MISEDLYAKINTACDGQWGTFDAPKKECADLLEDPGEMRVIFCVSWGRMSCCFCVLLWVLWFL
jgi:hypothetical protein